MTDAERASRFTHLTDVLKLQADLARAGSDLRAVRDQLAPLQDQLKRQPSSPPSVVDAAARLDTLEREVQEVRTRVNALFFAVIAVAIADLVGRVVLP